MNKCLITKIKGSVDNSNLPIFDQLKVKLATGTYAVFMSADTPDDCVVTASPDTGGTVDLKNSSGSASYSNPFTLTSNIYGFRAVVTGAECTIAISHKSKLSETSGNFGMLGVTEGAAQILSCIPDNTVTFLLEKYQSNEVGLEDIVSAVASTSVTKISINQSPYIQGNISSLAQLSGLVNIDAGQCYQITGDISSLGSMTDLANIAITSTQVSGTIESFVAAQRTAGRTTGSITGNSAGWGQVTFNGSTTNAKGAVSWTETTITMNGVTITA